MWGLDSMVRIGGLAWVSLAYLMLMLMLIGQHAHGTHRYDPGRAEKEECLRLDDIKELLGLELLGVIPESKCILTATNLGQPVVCMQDEEAGQGGRASERLHSAQSIVHHTQLTPCAHPTQNPSNHTTPRQHTWTA